MKLKLVIVLSFFIFSASVCSKIINSKVLYDSPDVSDIQLSFDGKFISGIFFDSKSNAHKFHIIDVESKKIVADISLGKNYNGSFYNWLSPSEIYFEGKNRIATRRYLLEFNGKEINSKELKAYGYFVANLGGKTKKILFAKKPYRDSKVFDLYMLSNKDFANENFSNNFLIKKGFKEKLGYFYDDYSNYLLTIRFNEGDEIFTIQYSSLDGKWEDLLELDVEKFKKGFEIVQMASDEKLIVLTNWQTDKMVLQEYNLKTKQLGEIIYSHPKYDLVDAFYNSDGDLEYVKFYEHGRKIKNFFDKKSKVLRTNLKDTLGDNAVYVIDKSDDERNMIIYSTDATNPGEYFYYDANKKKLDRLFLSHFDLEGSVFNPTEVVTSKTSDGLTIEGYFTQPKGINNHALIVMPHGGPIKVRDRDNFNMDVQYLTSRGFSVLRVNFRGSEGFGKLFEKQGVGEIGKLIEEDISGVVDKVVNKYKFKRVCSMGSSYGGYSAVMLAIKHPDLYDCVVASFGIYDIPFLYNESNYKLHDSHIKRVENTIGEYSEQLKDISPVYLSEKLKVPILLIAGKKDEVAKFEHTNRFKYILQKNNHPVETMFYGNAGHGHKTWGGDRHTAAISYEYIMRSLNLKLPEANKLTVGEREAIHQDILHIADAHKFGSYGTIKDHKKSLEFYQKALKYKKSARILYNLSFDYSKGSTVKKDIGKAIRLLEDSADMDYADAHTRLGLFYLEGKVVVQNWGKAYLHLTKAAEISKNYYSDSLLGAYHCLTRNKDRNIDKCIELNKGDSKKYNSKQFKSTLSRVIFEGAYDSAELEKIKDLLTKKLKIEHAFFKIEDLETGFFKKEQRNYFYDRFDLYNDGQVLEILDDNELYFGAKFEIDVPGIDLYKDKRGLVIKKTIEKESGEISNIYRLIHGRTNSSWTSLNRINKNTEKAVWTMEIKNFDQKTLFKRKFYINGAKPEEPIATTP